MASAKSKTSFSPATPIATSSKQGAFSQNLDEPHVPMKVHGCERRHVPFRDRCRCSSADGSKLPVEIDWQLASSFETLAFARPQGEVKVKCRHPGFIAKRRGSAVSKDEWGYIAVNPGHYDMVLAVGVAQMDRGLMGRAVKVRASALTSDPYTERDLVMPDFSTCTRMAASQAYEQAGVAPHDLDLVELHDCFATAEILHYENLALCEDGDAGRLIDDGETEHGGRIPVDVSGGLLSKGHPLGAAGIANIYEVATHLRGEAGGRQVEGAKLGLTHVVGMGNACAIHILEKPN